MMFWSGFAPSVRRRDAAQSSRVVGVLKRSELQSFHKKRLLAREMLG